MARVTDATRATSSSGSFQYSVAWKALAFGREKQDDTEDFLVLTPGIGLDVAGDGLGQQYRNPEVTVLGCGRDIITVRRGIYGKLGLVGHYSVWHARVLIHQ